MKERKLNECCTKSDCVSLNELSYGETRQGNDAPMEGEILRGEMRATDHCLSLLLPPFTIIDRTARLNWCLPAVLRRSVSVLMCTSDGSRVPACFSGWLSVAVLIFLFLINALTGIEKWEKPCYVRTCCHKRVSNISEAVKIFRLYLIVLLTSGTLAQNTWDMRSHSQHCHLNLPENIREIFSFFFLECSDSFFCIKTPTSLMQRFIATVDLICFMATVMEHVDISPKLWLYCSLELTSVLQTKVREQYARI